MHILITGGTGLIGSAFMQAYSKATYTVLTRNPQAASRRLGSQHEYVSSLDHIADLSKIDAIINLAGEPIANKKWSAAQKQRIQQSRWLITQKLIEAIHIHGAQPKVMISASAIGYYGAQPNLKAVNETTPAQPGFTHDVCQMWEKIALSIPATTRLCIARLGVVLDTEGGMIQKVKLPFQCGLGGRLGDGQQILSWIHLRDVIRLFEWMLNEPSATGTYNVTAPNPVTNTEFTRTMGALLKRPTHCHVPAWVLKLMLGEMASLLLEGDAVLPARLQDETDFTFQYPHLDEALSDLLLT
jgi:uncharacterized protein